MVEQRRNLGWNIKLPVHGNGAKTAMENYQDRDLTNFKKVQTDKGQFKYCLCLSDIINNILYEPYELRIASADTVKDYNVYYLVSATSVTKVLKSLNIKNKSKENDLD